MRGNTRYAGVAAAVVGLVLGAAGAIPAVAARPAARAVRPPGVLVWRVTALDARGHSASVFRAGSTIQLRIQWIVRNVAPGTHQTTTWTVMYAGKEMLRVTRTSVARNGNWSRSTTVRITRTPNVGTHIFWGRVSVGSASSARSMAFTVQR